MDGEGHMIKNGFTYQLYKKGVETSFHFWGIKHNSAVVTILLYVYCLYFKYLGFMIVVFTSKKVQKLFQSKYI